MGISGYLIMIHHFVNITHLKGVCRYLPDHLSIRWQWLEQFARSPEEGRTPMYTADGSQQLQGSCFLYSTEDQPYTVDIYRSCIRERSKPQIKEGVWSGNLLKQAIIRYRFRKSSRCRWREVFGGYYICDRG